MNRNVGSIGHQAAVRSKDGTTEVQPLFDIGGYCCQLEDAEDTELVEARVAGDH